MSSTTAFPFFQFALFGCASLKCACPHILKIRCFEENRLIGTGMMLPSGRAIASSPRDSHNFISARDLCVRAYIDIIDPLSVKKKPPGRAMQGVSKSF